MPPQAKQIKIIEIIEDHLGDTYPRVLANVVNDEGKESKLTIFKSKKGIVPQLNHAYMGYFKKPEPPYTIWGYNIAWEVSSKKQEEIETDAEYYARTTPLDETPPPTPPPKPKNDTIDLFTPTETANLRLRIAEIEARRENRLSNDLGIEKSIENCKRFQKYVETGE